MTRSPCDLAFCPTECRGSFNHATVPPLRGPARTNRVREKPGRYGRDDKVWRAIFVAELPHGIARSAGADHLGLSRQVHRVRNSFGEV